MGFNSLKEEFGPSKNGDRCSLEVLAFPCNQFNYEEPSENAEILNTIKYVRPGGLFTPSFKMFGKIEVNGENEHELFTMLKNTCPSPNGYIGRQNTFIWDLMRNNDINWNFAKFLIDHKGKPYRRYMPVIHPYRIRGDIEYLVKK